MFEMESSACLECVGFLESARVERLVDYSNPVSSIGSVVAIPLERIQHSGEAVVQAKCTDGSQDRDDAHDLYAYGTPQVQMMREFSQWEWWEQMLCALQSPLLSLSESSRLIQVI